MKPFLKCLLLFAALLSTTVSTAQNPDPLISQADWQRIIPYLQKEDWKGAEKISFEFLSRFKGDSQMDDEAGIVRYMYLKSVGGLLGDKDIDKDEAIKKLKGFEGKNIVTPFNKFKNDGMFNYLKLAEEGKTWWKCSANNDATVIHAFETFEVAHQEMIDDYEQFEGKNLRISAIIKEITAAGSAMPRLNIVFTDTDIWDMEE